MKAYSVDLRKKILNVYKLEGISQRQLAERFCVARSFIQKLLKQYRETGNIAPKPHGGGAKQKLTDEQFIMLTEIIAANHDATLETLCQLLKEKTGISISQATMSRMTKKIKLTLK